MGNRPIGFAGVGLASLAILSAAGAASGSILYSSPNAATITNGLVGYWTFNDQSGGNATNVATGAAANTAAVPTGSGATYATANAPGLAFNGNQAASLDGTSDFTVQSGDKTAFGFTGT